MKKGILIIISLLLIGMVGFVIAQSTNPWSADASGKEKNVFLPSDSVYVSSYTVCFGTNNISLYLLRGVGITSGSTLTDVRGQPQNIKTTNQGFITLTKTASNLSSGDYSIVLDCNRNAVYDSGEYSDVFNVGTVGSGTVEKNSASPSDFSFGYDFDIGNKEAGMLIVDIGADKESVTVGSIELQANGTGNDLADIEKVIVYSDKKEKLGQGSFIADNGKAVIALSNFSIPSGEDSGIIVDYVMKNFIENKTYSFSLLSVSAIGNSSGQKITFSGLPILSAVETIGKTKTCAGNISVGLSNNTAYVNGTVNVIASGITNCSSVIDVKLISCSNNITLCSISNGACSFLAPSIAGSYAVFACADKNGDGVYSGTGEAGEATLIVQLKPVSANNTISNTSVISNISTVSNITPITGNVVGNISGNGTSTGASFNVVTILSIGMIIIFVILVIILVMLFRLASKK